MQGDNDRPDVAQGVADATRRAKDAAKTVMEKSKDIAGQKLSEGVDRVADTAHTAASTLRRAADEVQDQYGWMGIALRKSADGIEAATQSLTGGDLNRTLSQISNFARREPAVFLGASLALGFALARVGKTAVEHLNEQAHGGNGAEERIPGAEIDRGGLG